MRIAHIVPRLECGGTERGVLEMAFASQARGHDTLVISNGGRGADLLADRGILHVALPVHEDNPEHAQRVVPDLARLFREAEIDLVDVHSRAPANLVRAAFQGLPERLRPTLVTSCHGFYSAEARSQAMLSGDRVIAVSHSLASYLLAHFDSDLESRLKVIYRGVDSGVYFPEVSPSPSWEAAFYEAYPILLGKKLITLVGRLSPPKGQLDFLKAAEVLSQKISDVAFLIVGEASPGRDEYAYEVKARARAIGAHLILTGYRSDTREILAHSAVAVCPSVSPEPFGRSMLEALSLGTPVVAYNHGGATEILSELLPEGLVPPGDPAALAERLAQFLDAPPKMRRNERFHLAEMIERTFAVYEEAYLATH